MRSLFGSLAGALSNSSPVPLAAARAARFSGINFADRHARGMVEQMNTYGSVGTVYAVVRRIIDSVSGLDWHLYRKAASGQDEDRTEVTAHAALDLWNRPNKFMSRQQFVKAFQQHKELTGEGNAVIGRASGVKLPLELWPIRPDRLTPVPDPYAFLTGWVYTGPDGEKIPLELDELLRDVYPSPVDPYRGMGPIQSILMDLDGGRLAKEWGRNFYLNGARPGGIIEVDRRLGDDEFDEMRSRWAEQHRGVSKAHRVAIIENGAKWIDTPLTQRDMQFVETNNITRETVLEAFGFPKGMLGIVEDVNRANAEAGEYVFGKWLIEPRAEDLKGMLNTQLLPLYGERAARELEFDYTSPVPENAELDMQALTARANATSTLLSIGGIKFAPAAVLEAVGLPDIEYEEVEPPAPPAVPPPAHAPAEQAPEDFTLAAALTPQNAQRWVAVECEDENTCEPCKANRGKLYRNREDAYKDYPNGEGYVKCIGAQYGNSCRGKIVKRRRQS